MPMSWSSCDDEDDSYMDDDYSSSHQQDEADYDVLSFQEDTNSEWTNLDDAHSVYSTKWTVVSEERDTVCSLPDFASNMSSVIERRSVNDYEDGEGFPEYGTPHQDEGDDNTWMDDIAVKRERKRRMHFDKRSHLHGRRGRHTNNYGNLKSMAMFELTRSNDKQTHHDKLMGQREYKMTAFDLAFNGKTSFEKQESWNTIIPELLRHARYGRVRLDYIKRKIFMFDLPIEGVVVDDKRSYAILDAQQRRSLALWKKVGLNTPYFEFRYRVVNYHGIMSRARVVDEDGTKRTDPSYFLSCVRPFRFPPPVELDVQKEEYAPVRMMFYSRATKPVHSTHLRVSNLMDEQLVVTEVQLAKSRHYYYQGKVTYMHDLCWASEPPPHADYDDWHMEIDLGLPQSGGRYVRAVVIQGQLPKITTFPNPQCFPTDHEFYRYNGPFFPVIEWEALHNRCWVENFEVLARQQKGGWFSLGVFRGNFDGITQVRVDLPAVADMKLRFLRIRPLSKNKKGFHGPGPAFRLGVVVLKNPTLSLAAERRGLVLPSNGQSNSDMSPASMLSLLERAIRVLPPCQPQIPDGFVRYEVLAPHTDILDVRKKKGTSEGEEEESSKIRSIVNENANWKKERECNKCWRKRFPPASVVFHEMKREEEWSETRSLVRNKFKLGGNNGEDT